MAMKKSKLGLPITLPIEIFYFHIFLKLPVKSLIRFKSICKEWNNILSDPEFVDMHLYHQRKNCNKMKLLLHTSKLKKYCSIDYQTIGASGTDAVHAASRLHFPLEDQIGRGFLVGSVNGLVSYSFQTCEGAFSTIIMWNPSTRDYKILPPNPDVPVKGKHRLGFCYNSIADDYYIVRLAYGEEPRLDIFSLKNNSWKLVVKGKDVPSHSSLFQYGHQVRSIDGSFFWLACHMDDDGDIKNQFIACLDLDDDDDYGTKKNLIRELPMPGDFDTEFGMTCIKVLGGCLAVFKMVCGEDKLVVWKTMKIENNTKYVDNDLEPYYWGNKMVINYPSLATTNQNIDGTVLLPVCLSTDGKILLYISTIFPSEFVMYDPKTKTMEEFRWICIKAESSNLEDIITFDENPQFAQNELYIETLVSPNNFISCAG